MKTNATTGVAMALAAAALWGTTGTAQTFGSGELAPAWFGALRLATAAAFFFALQGGASWRSPLWPVLVAGLCMAVYNLAFFAGIRDTGVAVGTAVALGSAPVWTGILQSVLSARVPSRGWWLGTALAIAGGVLMTVRPDEAAQSRTAGFALCLLAGLSYAGYTVLSKRLVTADAANAATFPVFTAAAALALPAAWFDAGVPVIQAPDVAALAYVGIASAGLAYLLFTHALKHISAATGVTLALGEPVMAFVLALCVVGERPSGLAIAGVALVIAGVLAVVRSELRGAL